MDDCLVRALALSLNLWNLAAEQNWTWSVHDWLLVLVLVFAVVLAVAHVVLKSVDVLVLDHLCLSPWVGINSVEIVPPSHGNIPIPNTDEQYRLASEYYGHLWPALPGAAKLL